MIKKGVKISIIQTKRVLSHFKLKKYRKWNYQVK